MVSSQSAKRIRRDRLYYGVYKYKASTQVPYASRIRYCRTPESLFDHINTTASDISLAVQARLLKLLNFRNNSQDCAMRLEQFRVSVYSNSLEALEIFALEFDSEITEVELATTDPDVLYRQNPRYKYRTYLRARTLTAAQQADIRDWFRAQTSIKASSALHRWLENTHGLARSWYNRNSLRADFYFEHDSLSMITAFNLCFTGLVGKTRELRSLA